MPLHDHFHAPYDRDVPWRSLHTVWPGWIMHRLDEVLPPGYRALPSVSLGASAQVDVATLEDQQRADGNGSSGDVATAVWAPPQPPLVALTQFPEFDRIEVQIVCDDLPSRLVGAVELVSPRNKDRPEARRMFAAKIASLLQDRVGVVVVDVVSQRRTNLHRELAELLGLEAPVTAAVTTDLYAVSYHVRGEGARTRLEMWPAELAIGGLLPVLPLWIGEDLAVPLDLEASYTSACQWFRRS